MVPNKKAGVRLKIHGDRREVGTIAGKDDGALRRMFFTGLEKPDGGIREQFTGKVNRGRSKLVSRR
jgi:hypothetical protein